MKKYTSHLGEIQVFEDGLPSAIFERLRQAVIAIGNETPDGKDTYAKTFWYDGTTVPTNVAEEAVVELKALAAPPDECIGMEWWIGRLPHAKKLRFHFDRDLSLSRKTGKNVFPLLSSVYYLNQYDSSPTIIRDQVPGEDGKSKVPAKVILSASITPNPNHYVVFPGNLLHGVIPDLSKLDKDDPKESRLTLLVNYWDRKPSPPVCCEYDGTVYRSLNE